MSKDNQHYEQASKQLPMKKIIINNFVGGIMWALGATIGLSLILAILSLLVKNINFVPVFGTFASEILDFVLRNNHSLQR